MASLKNVHLVLCMCKNISSLTNCVRNMSRNVRNNRSDGNLMHNLILKPNFDKTSSIDNITAVDLSLLKENEVGVLEPCNEDVSDLTPNLSPTYNLAAYANQSRTIQEFIKMGVDLYKVERRKGGAESILKLDFDKHVKEHLRFLCDIGVPVEAFGVFLTKNPFYFEQSIDDLQVRINYLEAKKFSTEAITRIVSNNPSWLNYSTVEIDKRLGFFQRTFKLSGDEVRLLATKRPTIVTFDLGRITMSWFAVKEDMGFNVHEAKTLLLSKPKLYHIDVKEFKERFDYLHNIMEISHEQLCQCPTVLTFRKFLVQQRHEFLKSLGKAQYNPKLPGYNSLTSLVQGDDVEFCKNVAKTSINMYNGYLKTL